MRKAPPQVIYEPWYRAAILVFAITLLFACTLVEEVHFNKDGSGSYRAELVLVGEEKTMLRDVKAEIEKQAQLEILDEGPRGADYFLLLGMDFASVEEIHELDNENPGYSWSRTEAGVFKRRARLIIPRRNFDDQGTLDQHRFEITMPGKIVDTNAERVSDTKVVWDQLAAGPSDDLYVESEFSELPAGYTTKIAIAAAVLVIGFILIVALRLRKRKE